MYDLIKLEIDVPIPMRDGIVLRADIWRPDSQGKFPVILVRLPYNKNVIFSSGSMGYLNFQRFVKAGYAVVIQDCRGTGSSDGEFFPWRDDTIDGYDTVEWTASQSWSNGNVGMMGASALGGTQWNAAITQPPHLKAICPAMTQTVVRGVPLLENGAYLLRIVLQWYFGMVQNAISRSSLPEEKLNSLRRRLALLNDSFDEQLCYLPLKDTPLTLLAGELGLPPFYSDFFIHIDDAEFWKICRSPVPLEKVVIPVLHMSGWYDPPLGGVLSSYAAMLKRGGSQLSRQNQKLLIGPWIHGGGLPSDPDNVLKLGSSAAGDIAGSHLRWFDHWLKGAENGISEEKPVRIFVMGDNVWRDESQWPLAGTRYTNYYLHSGGNANSRRGNGYLGTEAPPDEQPDIYLYDPRNVPSIFERGPLEQSYLENRSDVLVYTSAPLEEDLEVTGPVSLELYAKSSAVDTDFMGKITDVWPDGRSYNLIAMIGMVRARYRNGESNPTLIKPGEIYKYSVDLKAISNVFKVGHRIRLQISSSSFPLWDRNLNTGNPIGQDSKIEVAVQTILHDSSYPTHLVLPVIPGR